MENSLHTHIFNCLKNLTRGTARTASKELIVITNVTVALLHHSSLNKGKFCTFVLIFNEGIRFIFVTLIGAGFVVVPPERCG